jgi:hypothetical protein
VKETALPASTLTMCRAEVAVRSLDPQHLDCLAGKPIGGVDLGRGAAATEIGDAQIGAEKFRAVEPQARLIESAGVGLAPQIRKLRCCDGGHWDLSPSKSFALLPKAPFDHSQSQMSAIAAQYDWCSAILIGFENCH